jgi:hypothetical protein
MGGEDGTRWRLRYSTRRPLGQPVLFCLFAHDRQRRAFHDRCFIVGLAHRDSLVEVTPKH